MKKFFALLITVFVFSSCANTAMLSTAPLNVKSDGVELYYTKLPEVPYEEIALISVYYAGDNTAKLFEIFREKVKSQQGDAAVNVSMLNTSRGLTLSGVAVKLKR